MKKLTTSLSLILALAGAAWAGYGDFGFKMPSDVNRNLAYDLSFVGARTSSSTVVQNGTNTVVNAYSNANLSATKQFVKGEGVLYGVEIGTGAATNWVECIDAAAGSATRSDDTTVVRLMVPCVASSTASVQCGTYYGGGFNPPRHFVNGLYCFTDSVTTQYLPVFRLKSEP